MDVFGGVGKGAAENESPTISQLPFQLDLVEVISHREEKIFLS